MGNDRRSRGNRLRGGRDHRPALASSPTDPCCLFGRLPHGPPQALLAMRAPVAWIAGGRLLAGGSFAFFGAVWITTLQRHVPPEAISRVSAYDWMGSQVFLPLGLLVVGPVEESIGASATMWISTAWAVVSTTLVLSVRSVREVS